MRHAEAEGWEDAPGMGMVGPLFEDPAGFDRAALAGQLRALAERQVLIGGSSWKYEGWLGQVYSRERYLSRGRFSSRLFQSECLREYAETFPIVCDDFSFYQFPKVEFWRKLFGQVPAHFQFAGSYCSDCGTTGTRPKKLATRCGTRVRPPLACRHCTKMPSGTRACSAPRR
jgi:hypothetical protein